MRLSRFRGLLGLDNFTDILEDCFTYDFPSANEEMRVCESLHPQMTDILTTAEQDTANTSRYIMYVMMTSSNGNGWVNNREAGDLRRPRAHYYVIVVVLGK